MYNCLSTDVAYLAPVFDLLIICTQLLYEPGHYAEDIVRIYLYASFMLAFDRAGMFFENLSQLFHTPVPQLYEIIILVNKLYTY